MIRVFQLVCCFATCSAQEWTSLDLSGLQVSTEKVVASSGRVRLQTHVVSLERIVSEAERASEAVKGDLGWHDGVVFGMSPGLQLVQNDTTLLRMRIQHLRRRNRPHLDARLHPGYGGWSSIFAVPMGLKSLKPSGPGYFLPIPWPSAFGGAEEHLQLGPEDPRVGLLSGRPITVFNMLVPTKEVIGWQDNDVPIVKWVRRIEYLHEKGETPSEQQTRRPVILAQNGSVVDLPVVEKNWTPLNDDASKLMFVRSLNPLQILECAQNSSECRIIFSEVEHLHIGSLRGGTQFLRWEWSGDGSFLVAIAHSTVEMSSSGHFLRRGHLVVLSTQPSFELVYVSGVLPLITPETAAKELEYPSDNCSEGPGWLHLDEFPAGLVIDPEDRNSWVVSFHINEQRSFVTRVEGLGSVVDSVIDAHETRVRTTAAQKTHRIEEFVQRSVREHLHSLGTLLPLPPESKILLATRNTKRLMLQLGSNASTVDVEHGVHQVCSLEQLSEGHCRCLSRRAQELFQARGSVRAEWMSLPFSLDLNRAF